MSFSAISNFSPYIACFFKYEQQNTEFKPQLPTLDFEELCPLMLPKRSLMQILSIEQKSEIEQ